MGKSGNDNKGDYGDNDGDDNESGQEATLDGWIRSCFALDIMELYGDDVSEKIGH